MPKRVCELEELCEWIAQDMEKAKSLGCKTVLEQLQNALEEAKDYLKEAVEDA